MLVTGIAQLLMAPVAVALEQRADARLLTGLGFAVFATGLAMSGFQTPQTDSAGMFWPQVGVVAELWSSRIHNVNPCG